MQLNATIHFDRQRMQEILEDKLKQSGYVLEGEFTWEDEGDATVNVRPMTFEEKEDAGVETRDPAQVVADAINTSLSALSAQTAAGVDALKSDFEDLRKVIQSKTYAIRGEASQAPRPRSQERGVTLVTRDDYGLGDEDDTPAPPVQAEVLDPTSDEAIVQARLRRLRKEQEASPEIYSSARKDAQGFVSLGQNSNE